MRTTSLMVTNDEKETEDSTALFSMKMLPQVVNVGNDNAFICVLFICREVGLFNKGNAIDVVWTSEIEIPPDTKLGKAMEVKLLFVKFINVP